MQMDDRDEAFLQRGVGACLANFSFPSPHEATDIKADLAPLGNAHASTYFKPYTQKTNRVCLYVVIYIYLPTSLTSSSISEKKKWQKKKMGPDRDST